MRISDWSSDVCSSDLLAVEHFIDAIGLADRGHQILHGQAALFHAETNCFDGVGRLDRGMPGFVGFHQRDQDLEAVAFLAARLRLVVEVRSEEHTSELQSLMRISYAVFFLKKKKIQLHHNDQELINK